MGSSFRRPPTVEPPVANSDPEAVGFVPPGETDSALASVKRIAKAIPYRRIQRKAEPGEEEAKEAEVSQPGEPAEKEADAVADDVADRLHGGDDKKHKKDEKAGDKAEGGADEAVTEEKAPEIGAKLDPGVIPLARDDKNKKDDKKDEKPKIGAKGTQCTSLTVWKGVGKERLDVENPNPGKRDGQLHFQDNDGNKFLYDFESKTFRGMSKTLLKKMEKAPGFQDGVQKGLGVLGEGG
jgi:hypothetical protein